MLTKLPSGILSACFFIASLTTLPAYASALVRVKVVTTVSDDPNDLIASAVYGVPVKLGSATATPAQGDPARIQISGGRVTIKVEKKWLVDEFGNQYRVGSVTIAPTRTGVVSKCGPVDREGNVQVVFSEKEKSPTSASDYEVGVRFVPLGAPKLKNPNCKFAVAGCQKKKSALRAIAAAQNAEDAPKTCSAPTKPKTGRYGKKTKSGTGDDLTIQFKLKENLLGYTFKGTMVFEGNKLDDNPVDTVYKIKGLFLDDSNLFKGEITDKDGAEKGTISGEYDAKKGGFVIEIIPEGTSHDSKRKKIFLDYQE